MSKKIATHDREFHADDVFAVATLLLYLEEPCEIIRTRDSRLIDSADYVVDVGDVYDRERKMFDHHQLGGAGKRNNGIEYASFGLVWKEYGEQICGSEDVRNAIDNDLVSPIDAGDNGIDIYKVLIDGVGPYDVSQVIDMYLPSNNDDHDLNHAFNKAVDFAKFVLNREIETKKNKFKIKEIINDVYSLSPDKKILIFDDTRIKWDKINKEVIEFPELIYIIFPDGGNWRVKAVRENRYSFKSRKNLPENWAGKRGDELARITGVDDAIFCHRSLFTCGAKSKEGAISLAKLAINS